MRPIYGSSTPKVSLFFKGEGKTGLALKKAANGVHQILLLVSLVLLSICWIHLQKREESLDCTSNNHLHDQGVGGRKVLEKTI